MECEAVLVVLWEYLDEELGSKEAEAVGSHVHQCPRCHPAYCRDRAFLEMLARLRHPAPATLMVSVLSRLRLP